MRPVRFFVLAAALAASGCFAYIPSSPQEIVPGEGVRLRLTAEEAARYLDLRLPSPRIMEGTLVDRTGTELLVEASIGSNDPTRGTRVLMQRVSVPLTGIVDVEEKKLDTFRTGLLVGGGAALAGVLIFRKLNGIGGEEEPPPDVPEARRIPILRFALPFGGR